MYSTLDPGAIAVLFLCSLSITAAHPGPRLAGRVPVPQATPPPESSPSPSADNQPTSTVKRIHALSPSEAIAALAQAEQQANGLRPVNSIAKGGFPSAPDTGIFATGTSLSPLESSVIEAEYRQFTSEYGAYDSSYYTATDDSGYYGTSLSPSESAELEAEYRQYTSEYGAYDSSYYTATDE